jgi:MoxR-like ATPase
VRGAIDLALLAAQLFRVRAIDQPDDPRYVEAFLEVMLLALSGRLLVDEASGVDAESIIRELWEQRFVLDPAIAEPG